MPVELNRLQQVFLAAAAVADPVERAAVLDRECGDDCTVRQRVEMLLAAHDDSAELPDGTAAYVPRPAEPLLGDLFAGRYKLREKLGEGGMGVVFVADQLEPVQRRVALKIIRSNLPSEKLLARFEQERQALALMDHPNIAKVFDAGIAETTPYFVMELVKGVSITRYCDDARLTPKQRLQLFVPICQAVQHAHQKGIIHRDLKPSNIIVGLYDGSPVPKVIDFGVAKMSGPRVTEHSVYTEVGTMVGTLEYMSPEQAELNNLDIDTRSDVYALGVILYELLTGTVPLTRQDLKTAGFAEMLRIIKDQEPPKPSTRLSSSGNLPSVAAMRQTEPGRLAKLVRGELDWIVMKALEKNRTRRYETANGFAADVQRYLAGEPVLAVPPSAVYRLRKFAKKNRASLTTAAAIALFLVAGVAISTWQAIRANQAADAERLAKIDAEEQKVNALRAAEREAGERKKAEVAREAEAQQKKLAQAKEAEANAVIEFFEDHVFAAGRPKGQDGGRGSAVSLRDAILASLPVLRQGLADQPLAEARLRKTLGTTFAYLGEAERAAEQLEQARALFTRHRGPDHPETLTSMNNLASIYAALNRHAEALKLREETLAAQKRVLPQDHPSTLLSMCNLANSYAALNRHAEALKLHEETLAARKRVLPPDHPETLSSMVSLANSYAALDRHAEALKLLEETLAVQKRVLPPDHPDTLGSMNNLAGSYFALDRHAEALKLYEETLAARKRVLPPDHPDTLHSMYNLANNYARLNRQAEAVKLHEETLAARKRVLPPDHPDTLYSMWGVVESLFRLDRGAEAIPLIDECVAKAAGKGVEPRLFPELMNLRLQHFRQVGDPAGCRATAVMWEKLNRTDTGSLYDAACFRAVAAAVRAKIGGADVAPLAKEDADRAMDWLTKAVAAGYKNAPHMKKDPDLDFLRDRPDFQKLLAELERKAEKK